MTDDQAIEGAAQPSVDDAELASVQEAIASTAAFKASVPKGMVRLYHPEYESLTFGDREQGDVIQFGPKGNFEPHVWIGPEDHPLLPALLAGHPAIRSVDAPNKVYVCDECGAEFKVIIALRSHRKTHKPG